jgi:diaminohydroxyphosphoribosylaminopyrimidine deaminase/5-amino-6-(5-phosphoribosylamino)uracil reductase
VFVAPKVAGGAGAPSPVAGRGAELMRDALALARVTSEPYGPDVYVRGFSG